jgi:hypothetical protein
MPINDRDKLNRIEELKSKLFSKNYQTEMEHPGRFTHQTERDVPDSWEDDSGEGSGIFYMYRNFFMKTSMFKKFFFFSLGFFILTLCYAAFVFFAGGNTVSNDNIDISIIGNNFTTGGEELPLIIGITNRNSLPLDLVDLVIEYPKGGDTDLSMGTERSRLSLGTIPAGSVRNENVKIILYGQEKSIRPIKISLEYRVEGSNAIFVKEKPYEVTINSTPINLFVDAPTTISPNQDINFNIKVALNSTKVASKILLKMDYPSGFVFGSATPAPTSGNNIWSLGDLAPGSSRNIAVVGKIFDASDGEEKTFHISSGIQSNTDKSVIDVVFNSLSQTLLIKKPFISANLFINGLSQREYATDSRTPIVGEIRWSNNLDTKVDDLQISAHISGNAFDRKKITADQGFYDSSKDTIVWDKNSQTDFAEVSPGESGYVKFTVSPLSLLSAGGGLLSDPSVKIEISISGKDSLGGLSGQNLNNTDTALVKIVSDAGLATKALYYSGPFANTGPIPPKVEKPTSYTIVWSVSNTSNSIGNAVVKSSIPAWVRFLGTVSPTSEDLTYNPSTKEIVWNIGKISRGTGTTQSNREVSFQISLSPSLSQIGAIPVLVNNAVLTGHDDFANVDVRVEKGSLRTSLDSDPAFPANGAAVVE